MQYILDMAKEHAVTDAFAKFVDPSVLPLFEEQQRHFLVVEQLMAVSSIKDE